ncbi:sugar/pyridoxal phosphate phosphatase YigL [Kistimonas scapharcae]|uniref:Sugar/pyridoxal phosphate phosphatase YigL n=1 Tax=Kistimonas scapharcae TaxID=1036133 RepID=A0ABP8V1I9_9GAMM
MYRIVVTDLDGTLLNQEHAISESSSAIFRQLSGGIRFIMATGRPWGDARYFRDQLNIPIYLISSNGARVHSPEDEVLVSHDLTPDLLTALYTLSEQFADDTLMSVNQEDRWFVTRAFPELAEYHRDSGFTYLVSAAADMPHQGVCKVFFNARNRNALLPLEAIIRESLGEQVSITWSSPECLEIMAAGVNKGQALAELLPRLHAKPGDIMAFGDGLNDLEMLSLVGRGVCMQNADPLLKSRLPSLDTTLSNHEHGVACYLRDYYLGERTTA